MLIYIQIVNLYQIFLSFLITLDINSITFDLFWYKSKFSILSIQDLINFVTTIDFDSLDQKFDSNPIRLQIKLIKSSRRFNRITLLNVLLNDIFQLGDTNKGPKNKDNKIK